MEAQADGSVALKGGDQLWFGRDLTLRVYARNQGRRAPQKGRYHARRQRERAEELLARPVSEHLLTPMQGGLFELPARDWSRIDAAALPALTPSARTLFEYFIQHLRDRGVDPWQSGAASVRALRLLVAHLGAEMPFLEADVKAIAGIAGHSGQRVACFLRERCLLVPDQVVDYDLARARSLADGLPGPGRDAVHTWIDVLLGQGSRTNPRLSSATIYRYAHHAAPALERWAAEGVGDMREITREHVQEAVRASPREQVHGAHTALRSLFRALKRERMIFRDPARSVHLTLAVPLPVPIPSDRLRGLLDRLDNSRSRLLVALVAIHGLAPQDLPRLRTRDLDRSSGRLLVRRPGKLPHTIYLDEYTAELVTAWLIERHRRWPRLENPHLIVSRTSIGDDRHPPVSKEVTREPFRRLGIPAGKLREDRIYDEARHTADPVGLMRMFGLAQNTAMKYITAAHPEKRADPIHP